MSADADERPEFVRAEVVSLDETARLVEGALGLFCVGQEHELPDVLRTREDLVEECSADASPVVRGCDEDVLEVGDRVPVRHVRARPISSPDSLRATSTVCDPSTAATSFARSSVYAVQPTDRYRSTSSSAPGRSAEIVNVIPRLSQPRLVRPKPAALPRQVGDLGGVAGQGDRGVVGVCCRSGAAEAAQQIRTRRMEGVVVAEFWFEVVHEGESAVQSSVLADGDSAVEPDDRRPVQAHQLVVEGDDLRPVRAGAVGVHGVDRGQQLVPAWRLEILERSAIARATGTSPTVPIRVDVRNRRELTYTE